MAQLIVRNLDDDLVRELKLRAARHGNSAEEEHRAILRAALRPGPREPLTAVLLAMPDVGDDDDFARPRDTGRTVDLPVGPETA